jgi:hypothetical protein
MPGRMTDRQGGGKGGSGLSGSGQFLELFEIKDLQK